jgi:hypothetical protein
MSQRYRLYCRNTGYYVIKLIVVRGRDNQRNKIMIKVVSFLKSLCNMLVNILTKSLKFTNSYSDF